ncbi:MAG: PQQ-dependent dehydrogenase, methanol/ethanol family [Gammaproteobacteria bacterium]|nr:PQQ-dependent dehydrogenase, methanol/ethanol family [Gammaproteobacteria bacterium]
MRISTPFALRARLPLSGIGLLMLAGLLPALAHAANPAYEAVTEARLLGAQKDLGWLMYRRDYTSSGYAPFDQINAANVAGLKPVFDYKTGLTQGHESPPVVNGRFMFITTPMNHLIALDATTGAVLWTYVHDLSKAALKTVCCDVVNRGVALFENKVYMATLDNRLVALDGATGKVLWNQQLIGADIGYAMTLAPLVVKGKVIVGVSGGEYGGRGFIEALDAGTGKRVWKTYTIPAPNEPGGDTWPKDAYKTGGGGPWLTGTYDAEADTLMWGVGNPGPWLATLRPGDNLYTDSVIAMNPATGKIKWHFQYTPNDSWDYDGANETVMVDLTYGGKPYKAVVSASRNGWFYAIDRTNGKLIYMEKFAKATSVTGHKDGKVTTDAALRPTVDKEVFTCPSFLGGKNWWPISVNPVTRMAYVPTMHTCMKIKGAAVRYKAGLPFLGESFTVMHDPDNPNWGSVQGISLDTGKQVWSHASALPWNDGTLSTGGGLVFSGSADGHFMAFDAKVGKVLWTSEELSSGIIGVPSTYMVDGKQYVAVYAGWGGASPIWGGDMANDPRVKGIPVGGHLYVFRLQ